MLLSKFQSFRRFPAKDLQTVSPLLASLFRRLDHCGKLSDFIADPLTSFNRWTDFKLQRQVSKGYAKPIVSIIVATRNNGLTLERSIRSLLAQTYAAIEVVVIDDASDDATPEILTKLSCLDKRVKTFRNVSQLGTGLTRNVGLLAASGSFITFQDGDDFSEPNRIAVQLEALLTGKDKYLCLCNYVRTNEYDESLEIGDRRVMKCIISMMFRRDIVLDRVGFFKDSTVGEDSDYYQRIKFEFGLSAEVLIFRTLYRALFRENSSFFSIFRVKSIGRRRFYFENGDIK
ncbi:glycosyltransferase family 2 protein [Agrobacterium larrymoorei]|nr:glycosyltransferase family 2 protein [Agrobacterium larrymoorei]